MTGGTAGAPAVRESAARAVMLLVLTGAAFTRTWARVAGEAGWGSGSTLLLAAPLGAVLTAIALDWRRRPELPIYDRQTDKIVGTVILTIALMLQWLVLPRYAASYVLLHLDIAAAWMFLLGGCVLVFGLRRVGRYWPAWLLVVLASPGVVRLGAATLGGDTFAAVTVAVVVVLIGPAAVWLARLTGGRGRDRSRWSGPAVTPREAWRSVPLLVVVAVLLALAPLPPTVEERLGSGPAGLSGSGQGIPAGWTERSLEDFPWAARMYGPGATLHRQFIRATAPRAEWDALRRPRQAVVQTLTVDDPGLFDAYPIEMTYDLGSARISPPESVELTRGVTGRYRTVIDDERLLTWSLLSFVWTRSGDRVQRVSILTVDDHEYDAEFPRTVPGTRSTFGRMISLLLRGKGSITAEDTEGKDRDLLTELARDLVETQWMTQ